MDFGVRNRNTAFSGFASTLVPGIIDARNGFEAFLMDLGFSPDERFGGLVVGGDEGIDVLPELFDGCEGGAVQGLSFEDREPDFHLIEPGSACRREVELNIGV